MELIKQQEGNSAELQQAIKNFKKSPSERKTLVYLQQQRTKITQHWEQVNKTDTRIRNDTNIPVTHEYYTSDVYGILGEMYQEIITRIEDEINMLKRADSKQLDEPSASSSKIAPVPKLPVKLQKGIKAIKEMLHQVIHDTEPRSAQYYLMKVKTIEHHWKIVQQLHEQLWTAANDDYDLDEFLLQETEINEQIFNYNERFNSAESNMKKDDQSISCKSDVRLPKIELPNFDGNYLKWSAYSYTTYRSPHPYALGTVVNKPTRIT